MERSKFNKDGDELTRYGFISHMEAYIKQLLADPIKAKVDDYLESHGIDSPTALKYLLEPSDKANPESAIILRKEHIKTSKDTGKDFFTVKYSLPRKDYDRKMRNLYIKLFENYQTNNPLLTEDGEGATNADASGQFVQPLFGKPITRKINRITSDDTDQKEDDIKMPDVLKERNMKKRTVILSEEQIEKLREATPGGFPIYDAPASITSKNDPTLDHSNMMAKSWQEGK